MYLFFAKHSTTHVVHSKNVLRVTTRSITTDMVIDKFKQFANTIGKERIRDSRLVYLIGGTGEAAKTGHVMQKLGKAIHGKIIPGPGADDNPFVLGGTFWNKIWDLAVGTSSDGLKNAIKLDMAKTIKDMKIKGLLLPGQKAIVTVGGFSRGGVIAGQIPEEVHKEGLKIGNETVATPDEIEFIAFLNDPVYGLLGSNIIHHANTINLTSNVMFSLIMRAVHESRLAFLPATIVISPTTTFESTYVAGRHIDVGGWEDENNLSSVLFAHDVTQALTLLGYPEANPKYLKTDKEIFETYELLKEQEFNPYANMTLKEKLVGLFNLLTHERKFNTLNAEGKRYEELANIDKDIKTEIKRFKKQNGLSSILFPSVATRPPFSTIILSNNLQPRAFFHTSTRAEKEDVIIAEPFCSLSHYHAALEDPVLRLIYNPSTTNEEIEKVYQQIQKDGMPYSTLTHLVDLYLHMPKEGNLKYALPDGQIHTVSNPKILGLLRKLPNHVSKMIEAVEKQEEKPQPKI